MERKGKCKQAGVCSMYDKVQIITDDDAEFVCCECGEELEPYKEEEIKDPGDGDGKKKKLMAIIAAAVLVLGGGGAAIALSGGDEEPAAEPKAPVETVDTPKVDSVAVADSVKEKEDEGEKPKNPQPTPPQPAAKNPSWGRYDGARNAEGLPHGNGVLNITRSTTINGESAQPGEHIDGVFRNGYVNMGTWYKKDGNVVVVKDLKVI